MSTFFRHFSRFAILSTTFWVWGQAEVFATGYISHYKAKGVKTGAGLFYNDQPHILVGTHICPPQRWNRPHRDLQLNYLLTFEFITSVDAQSFQSGITFRDIRKPLIRINDLRDWYLPIPDLRASTNYKINYSRSGMSLFLVPQIHLSPPIHFRRRNRSRSGRTWLNTYPILLTYSYHFKLVGSQQPNHQTHFFGASIFFGGFNYGSVGGSTW